MFQYKQSRKKVKSLLGRGWWEEWFVLLGSPTFNPQGVARAQNASMAGEDGTKADTVHGPGARGEACCSRHLQLSKVGCCPGPPKPRMIQRKKVEPQEAASVPHVLCFLGQHYAHSIQSRTAQGR